MGVDTSVIEALRAAVAGEPDAHAVRLHLAGLLVLAGDPALALEHVGVVLAAAPDSTAALAVARDAARALGDSDRAEAYERLLGVPAARPVEPGDSELESR